MDEKYIPRFTALKNQLNNGKIRLAIFDCDGVLADTEKYHIEARREAIYDILGIKAAISDAEMLTRTRGISNELGIRNVLRNDPVFAGKLQGLNEEALSRMIAQISKQKQIYFVKILEIVEPESLAGLPKFLKELEKNKVRIALASANSNAWNVVEALKLGRFFDDELVVTGSLLGKKSEKSGRVINNKAEMFRELLLRSGANPTQTIGFEDAPHAIESFQELGIFAVGIDPEKNGLVYQADVVFSDFTDYFK